MPTYSILTTRGKNKEAQALATGTALVVTRLAFGNGDYAPTGGETSLQSEVVRKPVQASGTVNGAPNTAFFDCLLEAEDGPYTIREGGLFDQDGDLIAIIKYDPPVNKPVPASGQTVEALMRAHVVFSDLANLVIRINAINAFVAAERRVDTGTGLKGGGDLSQDRTHELDVVGLTSIAAANVDPAADLLILHDTSAAAPRKLTPAALSAALQIDQRIADAISALPDDTVLGFATLPEHSAGEVETKAAHPAGVKQMIAEAIAALPDPGDALYRFETLA